MGSETKVFKNEEALKRMEQWYIRFKDKIGCEVRNIDVDTSYGKSHVLLAGDPSMPPLLCLHAMLTSSAHLVSEIQQLSEYFYLIAPDIPGQSARGIDQHLSYKDDSHSQWLKQVLEALSIIRTDLLGVSLGGFVARQFASLYPERVRTLSLIVPAGIVQGSLLKGFGKMALPMIRYRMKPNEKNLNRLADHLLSTRDDEDWKQYLGDSFMDFKPNMNIPPLATDEELQNLTMPVLTIGAEEDISFPGNMLIQRVRDQIVDIHTELLAGSKHSPPTTPDFRRWLTLRVQDFINS